MLLNLMRKHARNWIMKLLLGIIVVVFIFYFGSMGDRNRAERIAMLDGKPIVFADFQREYQNMLDMYRQRFGGGLTEEMVKQLNLKQQALDNLVNQAVVMAKAEEMKIKVSEEDVKAAILAMPAFQQNKMFNERLYQQMLRANKMKPEEFETLQHKMLVALRIEGLIGDGAKVSDAEIYEIYRMQKEKINLDFVQIPDQAFGAAVKPTAADLESFLKSREAQFRVPEQVQVKYLAFLAQEYAAQAKISEGEIGDYYERNKARWKKGDKVQTLAEVRDQIVSDLAKVSGMYAAADEAKKAHDTIYQEENFDAYAAGKKLTVHTTALFPLSDPPAEFKMVADFAKTLARLDKKEISRVLQGEKGYYVLQVAQRKAPYLPALKEIEGAVEKAYRAAEAKNLAKKEAEGLLARLKKGEPFEALAREKKLKVSETGLFQPGGAIPKLGGSPEISEALYQISEKKPYPDKAYAVEDGYVIVRFRERSPVDDSEFASQKGQIAEYLMRVKRAELFKSWIEGSKAVLVKEGRLVFTKDFKEL
jgi:peptidyl-prolyl cis-trans isomerase D